MEVLICYSNKNIRQIKSLQRLMEIGEIGIPGAFALKIATVELRNGEYY